MRTELALHLSSIAVLVYLLCIVCADLRTFGSVVVPSVSLGVTVCSLVCELMEPHNEQA